MKKRNLFIVSSIFVGLVVAFAMVNLSNVKINYRTIADDSHDSHCVFNHYEAVMPTSSTHGSKEFWACCSSHHGYLLSEPEIGTIHEAGPFSGYYFDNLDPLDDRYIAPLGGQYSVAVNGGETHFLFVDVSEDKQEWEQWEKQWKVTLTNLERGDCLTIYANDMVLDVEATKTYDEYNDNNVALKNNDGTGNKPYVVAAGESCDLYLKYMPNGTYDLWLTGYNYSYDAFIRYTMGDNYDWIDRDMFVYDVQGEYDGSGPMASIIVEFGDLSRYVIYRGFEWINGVDTGTVHWKYDYRWTQYYAYQHTANEEYYLVMPKAGRYYIEAQGTAHSINWENYLNIIPAEFTLEVNGVSVTDEHRVENGFGYDFMGIEMHQNDSIYFYNRLNDHGGFPIFVYGEHNNYYGPVTEYPSNDFVMYREGIYNFYGHYDAYYTFTLEPVLVDTYWKMYVNDEEVDTELDFDDKDQFKVVDIELEEGDVIYFQTSEEGHDDILNYNNFNPSLRNDSYLFSKGSDNKIVAKHDGTYTFYVGYKENDQVWVFADKDYVAIINEESTPMPVHTENPDVVTLLDVELSVGDKVIFYDGFEKYFGYDNLKLQNGNTVTCFSRGTNGELVVLEAGTYDFYLDTTVERGIWVGRDDDPSARDTIYNINNMPDWTYWGNVVLFAWIWTESSDDGHWVETIRITDTSLAIICEDSFNRLLLVRCSEGTTTPNWEETGDNVGRIYNKSSNYIVDEGVYSFNISYFMNYPEN